MTDKKLLITTIGAISALSFSLGSVAGDQAGADLFEAEMLPNGFMADQPNFGEGSCGEGSCGEGSCGEDDKDEEGACGEGSCGEDDKDEEGACGEGTCGAA